MADAKATLLGQYAHAGPKVAVVGQDGRVIAVDPYTDGEAPAKKPKKRRALAGLPRDVRVLAVDAEDREGGGGLQKEVEKRLQQLWSDEDVDTGRLLVDDDAWSDEEPARAQVPPATQAFGKSSLLAQLGERKRTGKSLFGAEADFVIPLRESRLEGENVAEHGLLEGYEPEPFREGRDGRSAGSPLRNRFQQKGPAGEGRAAEGGWQPSTHSTHSRGGIRAEWDAAVTGNSACSAASPHA